MRGSHVGDPVAHGLVDGILQGTRTRVHAANFRSKQPHAEHIEFLTPHVFRAHVHDALETKKRAHRGRRHAVLAGAGLGDDTVLSHALDQQRLSQAVVDLVCASVQQVFAFEIDLGATQLLGQPPGKKQRRRTSRVIAEEVF